MTGFDKTNNRCRLLYQVEARETGISIVKRSYPSFKENNSKATPTQEETEDSTPKPKEETSPTKEENSQKIPENETSYCRTPRNQFKFQYTHHRYSPYCFREQISAFPLFVQRLHKLKQLKGHTGCVNTLHWSLDGHFLVSGGDDTTVAIWDYELGAKLRQLIYTPHTDNIFSAHFLPNGKNDYVASCARDGKVFTFNIDHGQVIPEQDVRAITGVPLYCCTCHNGTVKRLTVDPQNPMVFHSCGEDRVLLHDIRESHACGNADAVNVLAQCEMEIYSMDRNPLRSHEFVVGGTCELMFLFDARKPNNQVAVGGVSCETNFYPHVTGVAYSALGDEILGSYPSCVSLFTMEDFVQEKEQLQRAWDMDKKTCTQSYRGHKNRDTVKSVNFFGPRSEYIVSGSDCGRIFLWDKWSSKVVNCFPGDRHIVNCITGHPTDHCVLASSGIEENVYLWSPIASKDPDLSDLEEIIGRNGVSQTTIGLFRRLAMAQWMRNNQMEGMLDDSDEDALPEGCVTQ